MSSPAEYGGNGSTHRLILAMVFPEVVLMTFCLRPNLGNSVRFLSQLWLRELNS